MEIKIRHEEDLAKNKDDFEPEILRTEFDGADQLLRLRGLELDKEVEERRTERMTEIKEAI